MVVAFGIATALGPDRRRPDRLADLRPCPGEPRRRLPLHGRPQATRLHRPRRVGRPALHGTGDDRRRLLRPDRRRDGNRCPGLPPDRTCSSPSSSTPTTSATSPSTAPPARSHWRSSLAGAEPTYEYWFLVGGAYLLTLVSVFDSARVVAGAARLPHRPDGHRLCRNIATGVGRPGAERGPTRDRRPPHAIRRPVRPRPAPRRDHRSTDLTRS